ncbi:hypothetical protein RRG08_039493 [Elysia crispata]|uniref:Uncharacterized protein n=1 Tax=Elysia crispata TaxID=231223 RepID=A0AAE0YJZ0_9GAST|nr:hypothetical protein RRG08_039493 [Elysia crispata]
MLSAADNFRICVSGFDEFPTVLTKLKQTEDTARFSLEVAWSAEQAMLWAVQSPRVLQGENDAGCVGPHLNYHHHQHILPWSELQDVQVPSSTTTTINTSSHGLNFRMCRSPPQLPPPSTHPPMV